MLDYDSLPSQIRHQLARTWMEIFRIFDYSHVDFVNHVRQIGYTESEAEAIYVFVKQFRDEEINKQLKGKI